MAAMAAVTAAPTWRQQLAGGAANVGRGHLSYLLFLHNSRVRTYVITIVRCMAKHKSVLWQNTFKTLLKNVLPKPKVFWQNRKCFQSVGAVC